MASNDQCNACGAALSPWLHMPIDAKKNQATPYSDVLKCTHCDLGVLDPLPPAEAIPAFYQLDTYYTHGESHIPRKPSSVIDRLLTKLAWISDRQHLFAPAEIARRLPPGGSVCDLGCGNATHLRKFKALGFDVLGVDPDPAAREEAAKAGIPVEIGTGEYVPDSVLQSRFDLVIMTHSLEHCRDPKAALQNVYRLTKPGGLCYIEVPNCAAEHFRTFTICSEMFDAPRHIYFFTPDALSSLMQTIGFTPVEMLYQGYVRNFEPGWRGWESSIADRVTRADPALHPRHHSFAASAVLLARSFWKAPEQKYDSIGFLMQRRTIN